MSNDYNLILHDKHLNDTHAKNDFNEKIASTRGRGWGN